MLSIQFAGICCHVNPRPGVDTFGKRVILTRIDSTHAHIPYVEVESEDLASATTNPDADYTRGDISYLRCDLKGEEVIIDPIDKGLPFNIVDTYYDLVPSLKRLAPSIPPIPRPECFRPTENIIAGYFDITAGLLLAGERAKNATRFVPAIGTWPTQRNATGTELLLRLKRNALPSITLRSFTTGATRKINLKLNTYRITVGNQPLPDIDPSQSNGHSVHAEEHFGQYYVLVPDGERPRTPPLPQEISNAVNGCHPTNYP